MQNALPDIRAACLVSRTVVSADDPAFGRAATRDGDRRLSTECSNAVQ